MKIFNRLLKFAALLTFSVLAFVSCSNLDNNAGEESGTYIVVKSSARSALPDFIMSDFDKITLTGNFNVLGTTELGEWKGKTYENGYISSAYEELEKSFIPVPETGSCTLTLKAFSGNTVFEDTIQKQLQFGENSIHFSLKASAYDKTGEGSINLTFYLNGVSSTSDYSVNADFSSYLSENPHFLPRNYNLPLNTTDGGIVSASLQDDSIPSGTYLAVFRVSKTSGSNTLSDIARKSIIVTVTNGKTSVVKETFSINADDISQAETATTYTLSYTLNGGSWSAGYEPENTYNSHEEGGHTLPGSAEIKKEGFILEGWCESYSSEPVSAIPYKTFGNKTFSAKWKWDTAQTVTAAKDGNEGEVSSQTITWTSLPVATGYVVYSAQTDTAASPESYETSVTVTSTSYPAEVLSDKYSHYAVKAYYTAEDGTTLYSENFSNEIVYAPVTGFSSSSVSDSITAQGNLLTWNGVYGAKSYYVYKYTSAIATDTSMLDTSVFTAAEIIAAYNNESYNTSFEYNAASSFSDYVYYAVRACSKDDTSDPNAELSDWSSIIEILPATLTITLTDNTIVWKEIEGASTYKIYSCTSDTDISSDIDSAPLSYLSYSAGIPAGNTCTTAAQPFWTKYSYYKVQAVNAESETVWSNTITISPSGIPTAPVISYDSGSIIWNATEGASAGYKVFKSSDINFTSPELAETINSTEEQSEYSYNATFTSGYYYAVKAYRSFAEPIEETELSNILYAYAEESTLTWEESHSGTYYFTQNGTTWTSSNKGINSSTATSTWTVTVPKNFSVTSYTFAYEVSSESSYDKLTVTCDGITKVNAISGTKSGTVTMNLSEGTHTITASYSKDSSDYSGSDTGRVTLNDISGTLIVLN